MIPRQNQITTMTKQRIRECPVCDRNIQIAYSDYCIGCLKELRAILSTARPGPAQAVPQTSNRGATC